MNCSSGKTKKNYGLADQQGKGLGTVLANGPDNNGKTGWHPGRDEEITTGRRVGI
jgi:hypothetical protein